jgi:hypothetical protein
MLSLLLPEQRSILSNLFPFVIHCNFMRLLPRQLARQVTFVSLLVYCRVQVNRLCLGSKCANARSNLLGLSHSNRISVSSDLGYRDGLRLTDMHGKHVGMRSL